MLAIDVNCQRLSGTIQFLHAFYLPRDQNYNLVTFNQIVIVRFRVHIVFWHIWIIYFICMYWFLAKFSESEEIKLI